MTLHTIANITNPNHECIPLSFPNQFTFNPYQPNIEREDAILQHKTLIEGFNSNPNTLYLYTDGSLLKRNRFQRVSTAPVSYQGQQEIFHLKMGLGRHAECSDTELAALSMAANHATNYAQCHPEITSIHIFSDCTSALISILKHKPTAGQHYSSSFC
jgi:hypothetical protein